MRLRVVECNQCGSAVQLRDGASTAKCGQCNATVTLEDALRAEQRRERRHPNPTPLRIGMKGVFGGKEYQIIGRVVYSMVEEGKTYYWDEFQLLAADGDCLYLEYDEGQWKAMERFTPTHPIGPQEAFQLAEGSYLSLEGGLSTVTDIAAARVCHVQGETAYPVQASDELNYLDASTLNRFYTVEWTGDEIEFYRGRLLSEREVFHHFNLKAQIAALDATEGRRRSQKVFALVCLILAVLSFILWGISLTGGKRVSQASVPVASVPQPDGLRLGPITLDPGMHVHRLIIRGLMKDASAWVAGVLETTDGTELIGTQRDFWDESGYDSEGYWHEADLRAQTDFVVKQPNPYYIHLYAEPDTPSALSQTIGYELRGGVIYPAYFLHYGVLTLILSIIFFCVSSPEILKKVAESADDGDE